MTEYWVSQGNKWCDICKIYIANNPLSIRTHELGLRHKENVTKRLASIRKDNAAKEKELKEAARALEQIEAKAQRSYQKDLKTFQEAEESNARVSSDANNEWDYDSASGYYYDKVSGYHYDPNSGLFYSSVLGKWITQEEAFSTSEVPSESKEKEPISLKPSTSSVDAPVADDKGASKHQSGPPPGRVAAASPNPMRSVKGAPSSMAVKRKRQDEKPKVVSKEEEAALKAREAAKKRMEEREKPLLGLYKSY